MGRRQSLLEWSGMAFWHFQLRRAHLKIACWMLILIRFLLKISFLISIICFGKVMFFSLWNILRNNRVKAACSNKGPQETGAHPRSLERTHQRSCWSEDISRRSLLKFKAWTWKKQTKKTKTNQAKKTADYLLNFTLTYSNTVPGLLFGNFVGGVVEPVCKIR